MNAAALSMDSGARRRRLLLIAIPFLWLILFFLLPFGMVLKISLSDAAISIPPYTPQLDFSRGVAGLSEFAAALDLESYQWLAEDQLYVDAYLSSLRIAFLATALTLLVGYPVAYGMATAPAEWRPTLMMLLILPFWTSFLIRVYAWISILRTEGFLNNALLGLGVISEPMTLLNTETAVFIGIVYSYLPFMILPIYATLETMDGSLLEAAEDLGCTRRSAFWLVTLPLSLPGVAAGCFLVFIPSVGEFIIPDLLGGSNTLMIGRTLWVEFFNNRDWPVASAVAIVMLLILVVPIVLFQRMQERQAAAQA